MKFLVHSNGPNVSTGYGVQTRQLVERLHRDGHEVAISCTYGQQGGIGAWPIPGAERAPENVIPVYPVGYLVNSNDIFHNHAGHFFQEDTNGWIITLLDVWAIDNPLLSEMNVAAWCPVDHWPVPQQVLEFFKRSGAIPIAMSQYGHKELAHAGLDPVYIPLAVDTKVMRPTPTIEIHGKAVTGRQLMGVDPQDGPPTDAFVVGMVAMNKGWARDRKGFNEAFRAFGLFWRNHPEALLYMHCDAPGGAEGMDLKELSIHAGVPEHAVKWVDQYAYRIGITAERMAAMYTGFDVLLAPSHGEGFCVPLIEAQATGTPVIATDFSAQSELVGAGWLVGGQPEWDPPQHASYICPQIRPSFDVSRFRDALQLLEAAELPDEAVEAVKMLGSVYEQRVFTVLDALETAYAMKQAGPWAELQAKAVEFAAQYDADRVFAEHWQPFLKSLEPVEPPAPSYVREPMGEVAVIVPAMRRENLYRLVDSFRATNDGTARLHIAATDPAFMDFECEPDCHVWIDAGAETFAEKVNLGLDVTDEPWLLLVGDDVEFKPGWLEAARKLSADYDVIGTNDSSNGVKNPDVAAGRHADHFFVRRSYVDAEGGCLDGPGVLAPECYRHWYTDKEIIGLAKARGVFTPCLESVVEHHHPGYRGDEAARQADPVYMMAVDSAEADAKEFKSRLPLIEMQRVGRARVR